ncbi:excisionase family DNA-binding protein, partial [Rhizobium hidalgonense]
SRPTLIRALDEGRLPYSRVGTHRRIALTDVLDHREQRRREQYDALDAVSQSTDEDRSIPEVLDDLHRARKAVAAKRRRA